LYNYISINNFYKKRLIRILPTYWLGCFLGLIYLYFCFSTVVGFWDVLAKFLTIPAWIASDNSSFRFEQGNGPIVTVMAEIWLYILYPFCLIVINRIGWNKFMIVTASITLFCYLPNPPFELDRWWLISATPIGFSLYWWIGAYFAELMIRKDFKFFINKLKTIFLVYILIIFLSYTVIKWDYLRNLMFSILCGQILVFMCINEINLTEYKLKMLKAISLLGEKSFTLYVIHIPILAIGTSLIGRNLMEEYKYIVTFYLVGVSIIGTLICFKLIEHPSHQFAKNYR
jgi:peptidoglycan/LPS O-acetylase OafA/YrhL